MSTLSIRSSDIAGIRTPAEFYQRKYIHKEIQRDYFDIGTAAHAYILQPELWNDLILLADDPPEPDNLNKDGSLTKKGANASYLLNLKLKNPDKIVFEKYWYIQVIQYAQSIMSIPGFDKFINRKTGICEHSMKVQNGDLIKTGTADYIKPKTFICDLKFAADISDRAINAMFYDFDYHVRAAWYLDLWNELNPSELIDTFIYVFVQKSETPIARFMKLTETDINAGRSVYEQRIDTILKCYRTKDWILDSIETLMLPEWVYTKITQF